MHVNELLKVAVDAGASDLHLKVGSFPMMRVRGLLVPAAQEKRLDHEDVVAMSAAVMSTAQRQRFKDAQEVDLAYSVPGLGRFRCNIFQQRGTVGLVLRVIPMHIRSIEELGLPLVLKRIADEKGATVAQIALAWLLAQSVTTSVIIGARRLDQLEDNLKSVDVTLSADDLAALDAVSRLTPEYPAWMLAAASDDRLPGQERRFAVTKPAAHGKQ